MEKDIAPELLEAIRERLREKEGRDPQIAAFTEKLNARKATQGDVAQYSGRLGELLSETLREILTPDNLPEGKLYYNIAARTIGPMLREADKKINDAAIQAQKAIDEENGIGMKAVPAAFPEKRVNDLMYKIGSEETTPEQAQTLMGEPIENNCRKFFDEHVRHNADVRFKAGLSPMIVRTTHGGCCKWCASVAGKYEYGDVSDTGNDVFRRHARCRCTVEYVCDGKKQDVWSKKMWQADKETLEKRAAYGLERQKKKPTNRKDDRKRQEFIAEYNRNREKALAKADRSSIILHYQGQNINIPKNKVISHETEKAVMEVWKTISKDMPFIKNNISGISFGFIEDGSIGENLFNPIKGINHITLNEKWYSNIPELITKLKQDFTEHRSYETEDIRSVVAHEIGHNAHFCLALKRVGANLGDEINPLQAYLIQKEVNTISQEIYIAAFHDESYDVIQALCSSELGSTTENNAHELIAQSFGNYYYGKNKSRIAKVIVEYFKKELSS